MALRMAALALVAMAMYCRPAQVTQKRRTVSRAGAAAALAACDVVVWLDAGEFAQFAVSPLAQGDALFALVHAVE